jgi:hypothetical protein
MHGIIFEESKDKAREANIGTARRCAWKKIQVIFITKENIQFLQLSHSSGSTNGGSHSPKALQVVCTLRDESNLQA